MAGVTEELPCQPMRKSRNPGTHHIKRDYSSRLLSQTLSHCELMMIFQDLICVDLTQGSICIGYHATTTESLQLLRVSAHMKQIKAHAKD